MSVYQSACRPEPWTDEAICATADPEAWFPEVGGNPQAAKRICLGCPVREKCLQAAIARDERFGVWGGLTEMERRNLKRRKG